ncbi:hypothetical protein CKM354_000372200 [Cercospora kikuchii]|uniref:Threonine/serine exporter-like N-terminal domain-containing protein n=1 Tax=Cercospora kikuchii TaxID=84275 RepID=A0A9P3FAU1_9PEZI|nr:uncharacterized protein CKM354_000372200 [Cercospora kikuchii]GIZ40383.1 hypothetical protein CKM354_000372200 [Cercospora kikuchii]
MSTPVEEFENPFGDNKVMAESPKQTPTSSGAVTGSNGGTPTDRPAPSKGKKKVGFSGNAEPGGDRSQRTSWVETSPSGATSPINMNTTYGESPDASGLSTPTHTHTRSNSGDQLLSGVSKSHLPELSQQQTEQIRSGLVQSLNVPRPRPALRRARSPTRADDPISHIEGQYDDEQRSKLQQASRKAYEEAKRLETTERMHSEPNSRHASPARRRRMSKNSPEEIPLQDFNEDDDIYSDDERDLNGLERQRRAAEEEAFKLVRRHTFGRGRLQHSHEESESGGASGAVTPGNVTPTEERDYMEDYQPRPPKYRGGILGSLLKLYGEASPHDGRHMRSASGALPRGRSRRWSDDFSQNTSAATTPQHSPPESGASTPNPAKSHWYSSRSSKNHSTSSLAQLVGSSASFGSPAVSGFGEQVNQKLREHQERSKRPGIGKRGLSGGVFNRLSKQRQAEQFRITNHIAETIARQKYLMKLCKALMEYGAPTHRLEEYMRMSARTLETDAQFLYIPGSMIMSFEDRDTHTSEVKLVKVPPGLDLGKLRDVHEVYKEVIHDKLGVEEATKRLKEITGRKAKFNRLIRIPVYGLAAVCVGPFAFGARLIDLPIAFILGSILGILQLYVAPQSELYANVFEITAAVVTSFLARAFGSINNGDLFCFSALAQSSIALILPGYTVLCASLELQSRSIVAGSVRMVYAIIYSLFLGFGITVGTAIYGMIDKNATSETECRKPIEEHWFFFFVPGFTMCLIIINQAKWKQAPMMMIIAFTGYVVNFFSSKRFAGNTQVSNTLGALAIGVMANLYSRIGGRVENMALDLWENQLRPRYKAVRKRVFRLESRKKHPKTMEEGSYHERKSSADAESFFQAAPRRLGYSLAAAAMLPAIFVQVPSGLAVNGSLVSGIASANQITGNATNGTQVVSSGAIASTSLQGLNSIAFTVGYSVIQVAIGITVGLFLSAIVVYPLGKRRSGLFSF